MWQMPALKAGLSGRQVRYMNSPGHRPGKQNEGYTQPRWG